MTALQWYSPGAKQYEAGLDKGVLYLPGQDGVPWVGLASVTEKPAGESRPFYMDGEKYLNRSSAGEFEATINAYTYPDAFEQCDGSYEIRPGLLASRQRRKPFGMAYRTLVGNELTPQAGYKIHLIYNAIVSPTQRGHETLSSGGDPTQFSWDITTTPSADAVGMRRTSYLVIDSRRTNPLKLQNIEDLLYGTDSTQPSLPTVTEIIAIYDDPLEFMLTDHGDGTYTVLAPNSNLVVLPNGQWTFDWPTALPVDDDSFTISD